MRILSAAWFLFVARLTLVALVTLPLNLALREVVLQLADGDRQLLSDLVPTLADVALREPRSLPLALAPLALVAFAALAEPLADRAAAALNAGHSWPRGVFAAARELWSLLLVGVFAVLFRGAAIACVHALFRHAAWDMRSLALPCTATSLLGLFVLVILALRDVACVGGAPTVRGRLAAGLACLLRRPLAMISIAGTGRLAALAATAGAFAFVLRPIPRQGVPLLLTYLLVLVAVLAASLARAWRLAALAQISRLRDREAANTTDRSDAPTAPSLDPSA